MLCGKIFILRSMKVDEKKGRKTERIPRHLFSVMIFLNFGTHFQIFKFIYFSFCFAIE